MAEEQQGFFRNKDHMLLTSLTATLASFFIINWGVRMENALYLVGAAVLYLGLLLAPLSRFTAGDKSEDEE